MSDTRRQTTLWDADGTGYGIFMASGAEGNMDGEEIQVRSNLIIFSTLAVLYVLSTLAIHWGPFCRVSRLTYRASGTGHLASLGSIVQKG